MNLDSLNQGQWCIVPYENQQILCVLLDSASAQKGAGQGRVAVMDKGGRLLNLPGNTSAVPVKIEVTATAHF